MSRTMHVEDSVVVNADAASIYAQVAEPSQMGRWSPENRGAQVPTPGVPAVVGSTFVGRNQRGRARWVTRCTVTAAEPGVRFAFTVDHIGVRTPRLRGANASWAYTFEPVEGGTRVTESWTDDRTRWPDALATAFDKVVTRGSRFADFQRRNIATTLANLKRELEAPATT